MKLDFSAEVRWPMKFDRNPRLVILLNKLFVREYARKRGIETAKLFHVTGNPESFPFRALLY